MLHTLTAIQQSRLSDYHQKWYDVALSTAAVDPGEINTLMQNLAAQSKAPVPQRVRLAASPLHALQLRPELDPAPQVPALIECLPALLTMLVMQVEAQLDSTLYKTLRHQLAGSLQQVVTHCLTQPLMTALAQQLHGSVKLSNNVVGLNDTAVAIATEQWGPLLCLVDFAASELGCEVSAQAWQLLSAVGCSSGWIVPVSNQLRLICDRPVQLCSNAAEELHAEAGLAALHFSDGFQLYAQLGYALPERYGSVPTEQWSIQAVLAEADPQLREILLASMGYDRVAAELDSSILDADRNYEL